MIHYMYITSFTKIELQNQLEQYLYLFIFLFIVICKILVGGNGQRSYTEHAEIHSMDILHYFDQVPRSRLSWSFNRATFQSFDVEVS